MAAATSDDLRLLALDLVGSDDRTAAVARIVDVANGDRATLETARNAVARHLHANAGDWTATSALTLLNKALVAVGWQDRYDWRIRWSQPFKRP